MFQDKGIITINKKDQDLEIDLIPHQVAVETIIYHILPFPLETTTAKDQETADLANLKANFQDKQ